ncbi:CPBP family intramembrane metalloprotease [Nostoc paludosum FACHB-159]|uniref:CPBP family intramembrane metalloprotease n=1 Tax=Nostoc paludosum FACHB-159 TaxID=2692908 RepID=A0ABR8KB97_9NOSO|nr:CPBP family intramembrane metalloprotease [Nostoc sp. FACHB-857]MBD2736315.1 CPBP family intramembrane metalloprotease [Nostoc paludosum FACHB-159]
MFLLLLFITLVAVLQLSPKQPQRVEHNSNYAIHIQQDFNQPSFYPVTKIPPANLYKPIADWVGRLILPTKQQLADNLDWVWLEVQHAPPTAQSLVGKIVRLEWKKNQDLLAEVQAVTRDVNFTSQVIKSQKQGNIHPFRLNGIHQVGRLRSLAGANPLDDTIVALDSHTIITESQGKPLLQIEREPVLVTGRFYGLVKIIKPDRTTFSSTKNQKSTDYFLVQHYNPTSKKFDGVSETIRIPQQVIDTRNFAPSSPQQIERSPAGSEGWYIYGAEDINGVFTVGAIAPRSLFRIQPNQSITGKESVLNYIKTANWQNTEKNKGQFNTLLLNPVETGNLPNQSISKWQEGDKAILLHLFGGIGGRKAETLGVPYTVTGHFAFGIAEVVRDEFTNELRFEAKYHQIYAHNPDGIIAGTHTWADYMGNLQRGWLATRPVSDILIEFDPVTQDYDFDGVKLSPLDQLQQKLQMKMARYRVGDGTGGAMVSPATSCIQDSSQALYAAILAIKNQVATSPQIQIWLNTNPNHPQTLRFQQLIKLGQALEKQLAPLGIVRADWQSQASILAGTGIGKTTEPFQDGSIWAGLTTWRTIMPRQAQDELAAIFLKHGAIIQVWRTNQVGGWQADIVPIAPTVVFGQIQIPFTNISPLSILLNRFLASLVIPSFQDWLLVVLLLGIYSAIAIPIGWKFEFLQIQIWSGNWLDQSLLILRCLFAPAILEELIFRVFLVPHPTENINFSDWLLWVTISLLLFILYHPLNAKTFFKAGLSTFFNLVFLSLAALLGITCTVAYALTGSLWVIVLIHWVVVVVWLIVFGGMGKLADSSK